MPFIIFAIIWLISPIVLLILYLVQLSNNSDLKKQNKSLLEEIKKLTDLNTEKPADNIQTVHAETAEKPAASYDTNYDMSYAIPKNIPAATLSETSEAALSTEVNVENGCDPEEAASRVLPDITEAETAVPEKAENIPQNLYMPEKKSISTINIILILGALLLSLAGFIFAAAAWDIMNTLLRSVLLLSFSALFFGIHSVAERKLGLVQTGRIFYILGSIFLPAAVAAAGVLKIFGEYFSFYGDGKAAVFALMFITVCIPFFKGAHDYKFRSFAAVSFASFSAAIVSLIWQFTKGGDIAALGMSVFSLLVILTEPLVSRAFTKIFGEETIFAAEWKRFSSVNAWVLSVISLFVSDGGWTALAAFLIFSACFLKKSVSDKNGAAGTIAFAFFMTTALFVGFDPDGMSGFTAIIAATALIYTVLSAMGIFPEPIRKIMKVLGIIAAGAVAFLGVIENISLIADNELPSLTLIGAAAAIFAQLLILALRSKTSGYKAASFGAVLWLSAEISLYVFGKLELSGYAFSAAAAYLFMALYFAATRFTPLKKRLYSPANDIIIAAYAFICSLISINADFGTYMTDGIIGLGILAVGTLLAVFSKQEKFSHIITVSLTALTFFPFIVLFTETEKYPTIVCAAAVTLMLICIIAAVTMFIPKAEKYAKAYGIGVIAAALVYCIIILIAETYLFVPLILVTGVSLIYLVKKAFPQGKYQRIWLFYTSLLLTSLFMGGQFTDGIYFICFPAALLLLIFAVQTIFADVGDFEKIEMPSEIFLWNVMPVFSGIMLFMAESNDSVIMYIFAAVLGVCSVLLSIFRRNTLDLIFPIFALDVVLLKSVHSFPAAVFAVVFAIFGRLMFRKKIVEEKYWIDVFSMGSIFTAAVFLLGFSGDVQTWIGCILASAVVLNFVRREQTHTAKKFIMTVSALGIFPIWWTIPFFDIPDIIKLEFNLFPVVIFCILLRIIHKDVPEKVYNFSFGAAIACIVLLFIDALISGESFDAVFIGIVLLIMLAVSFIIKRKRWFVLAVASIVVSAALLSLRQLDSIAWLVYLALTGAALIALGVINEIKKQQKRSGEETKLTRFMSDWTW